MMERLFETFRKYITLPVIAGGLLFALGLFGVTLLLLSASRGAADPVGASTPLINIIPASTATPLAPMSPPTQTPLPAAPTLPPLPPGTIAVGAYVQVNGTEGDGLRLRTEANLSSQVAFLAAEGDVYQVIDGPRQGDGYTWWYVIDPYDQSPQGWAVATYLAVIQNP